jgi:Protein of unknown function (DUF3987)
MANAWGADRSNLRPDEPLEPEPWPDPDKSVVQLHRRPAPPLPLDVFGPWGAWILEAASAASCPVDYVAIPLLASASVLIGHARWARATRGWCEPPHIWIGVVGDVGDGKSPGADCMMRDVLPAIERKMDADFPERLREWRSIAEQQHAKEEIWKHEVRSAEKQGRAPPEAPNDEVPPEPLPPSLRQYDVTHEKVEELLALAAPKGLLIVRDEFTGWIDSMNAYNEAGRAFWIEAYGGRPYRVERKKFTRPLVIPRLAVGAYGGTQPDKVAKLLHEADDGLLARIQWAWPEPIDFELGEAAPRVEWAIEALDRLRELELRKDEHGSYPIMIPLAADAKPLMARFGREMQQKQRLAGGLLRSAYGKARGQALRLSIVIEHLWWCADDGIAAPPSQISTRAFAAATSMMEEYFMPMAERVYGDSAVIRQDRNAATLAGWIIRDKPTEVHVRHVLRKVRLPGLNTAGLIEKAAGVLVESGWLRQPPRKLGFVPGGARNAYAINPKLYTQPSASPL